MAIHKTTATIARIAACNGRSLTLSPEKTSTHWADVTCKRCAKIAPAG